MRRLLWLGRLPSSACAPPDRSLAMITYEFLTEEDKMAVRVTRNAGMLLLAIWLILDGLALLVPLPIPGVVLAVLALLAGVLILVGR